jgi:hypothetical protein
MRKAPRRGLLEIVPASVCVPGTRMLCGMPMVLLTQAPDVLDALQLSLHY